jgi:hypothetical protein
MDVSGNQSGEAANPSSYFLGQSACRWSPSRLRSTLSGALFQAIQFWKDARLGSSCSIRLWSFYAKGHSLIVSI